MSDSAAIVVQGARQNNLANVNVRLPHDALVVITGISGSGKSSLAYDTVYREGQRRFMESLSSYARQFLGQMERPDLDAIEGVSPTLCIDQRTAHRNPRSTVGTITEIYDHLRLLMARLGQPHCPKCDAPISRVGIDRIVDEIMKLGIGEKVIVMGPVVRQRKGEYRKELAGLIADGWVRSRIDGELCLLEEAPSLARYEKHTIEVVVDRIKLKESDRGRLAEAVETGLGLGDGAVVLLIGSAERVFSVHRGCPQHPEVAIPELEPRLFSFNAPQGACVGCSGLGEVVHFESELIVDTSKKVPDCFLGFNDEGRLPFAHFDRDALKRVAKLLGAPVRKTVSDWPSELLDRLIWGDPELVWTAYIDRGSRVERRDQPWRGLVGIVEHVYRFSRLPSLERFRVRMECPECEGARLNPIALAVRFRGRSIRDLSLLSVGEAHRLVAGLNLKGQERVVGQLLVQELRDRLQFLHDVGLDYLTLDRRASTLSGGEAQRIRLAAQVGASLQGVTYVLDEPSIGLHPRDNERLLGVLRELRNRGNTVLVVEHDLDTIRAADHLIELGPGAGRHGGQVVATGTPARIAQGNTLTGEYLSGKRKIPIPDHRRPGSGQRLEVIGARLNNLKKVNLVLPLGTLTVVTGVSGSGKSSLIFGVLERSLRAQLRGENRLHHCDRLNGGDGLKAVIRISQQPIGRTPRSNPATYTGAFDIIRDLFAATPDARALGYKKGRFSFNVVGGRCEACQGAGLRTIEMQFLPSVGVTCEVCQGKRFNAETLEVRYGGLNVAEVLEMTVEEAYELFKRVPTLNRILGMLSEVGLDYIHLGQPSTTLSGGEAQRVKLAKELHRRTKGPTLYLLDEPTTGLHIHDVAKLLLALNRLVDLGHTVVVVEHNTDVMKSADYLIDLGPEGGEAGGELVGCGTPEELALLTTATGQALAATADLTVAKRHRRRRKRGDFLTVVKARHHNLQAVDISLPHGKFNVVTGVSGSGKSSLAFDTIFSEGQRKYVESLSTYARRFLGRMQRPSVDRIEGLKPAVAIDQRARSHNPRSTVATTTEIHDVLRLLYARVGLIHCPQCASPVRAMPGTLVASELRAKVREAGWLVARLPAGSEPQQLRAELMQEGWTRLLDLEGREVPLDQEHALEVLSEGALLVVDRFHPARAARTRMSEAADRAYALGGGLLEFIERKSGNDYIFTQNARCVEHGVVFSEAPSPQHFSFNSRLGACLRCEGIGVRLQVDPARLFPQRELSFWEAIDGRVGATLKRSARSSALIEGVFRSVGVSLSLPAKAWPEPLWRALLDGLDEPLELFWSKSWGRSTRKVEEIRHWSGLREVLAGWKSTLGWLMTESTCPVCHGGRLQAKSLATRCFSMNIHEFCQLSVQHAFEVVRGRSLKGERGVISEQACDELEHRLGFLRDVGLGYLSLERPAATLSGGESQRIRLASQLGSQLTGVIYVLDEPTIGLHARDTKRLLDTLFRLRDLGNTLVVVEHDPDTVARADFIVDMGPAAGREGGQVVASGTVQEVMSVEASVTGRWLSGREFIPVPVSRRSPGAQILVRNPVANNLRCGDIAFPTRVWVSVAGVSGSGKSSLVMDTLCPGVMDAAGLAQSPAPCAGVELGEVVDRVVRIDQSPIGRSPRSTAATYCGILDKIRALFAETPGARARGWKPGRFSFNARQGRCFTCEGRGALLVEMHFLPDVWVKCEDCHGARYNRETLGVRYRSKSISDVLAMRADEALEFFANHKSIYRRLEGLVDVGLGYLSLGQPANTLSGGEAQRVKLAAELVVRKGHCLYILDEPTTGLHQQDVATLVRVLHRLVDAGHSVVTVEHHQDVLMQSDWVLELGPEGGEAGGLCVAAGTPEAIMEGQTATGFALRGHLDRQNTLALTSRSL
jgi:excinuclease ABC subunit A